MCKMKTKKGRVVKTKTKKCDQCNKCDQFEIPYVGYKPDFFQFKKRDNDLKENVKQAMQEIYAKQGISTTTSNDPKDGVIGVVDISPKDIRYRNTGRNIRKLLKSRGR